MFLWYVCQSIGFVGTSGEVMYSTPSNYVNVSSTLVVQRCLLSVQPICAALCLVVFTNNAWESCTSNIFGTALKGGQLFLVGLRFIYFRFVRQEVDESLQLFSKFNLHT